MMRIFDADTQSTDTLLLISKAFSIVADRTLNKNQWSSFEMKETFRTTKTLFAVFNLFNDIDRRIALCIQPLEIQTEMDFSWEFEYLKWEIEKNQNWKQQWTNAELLFAFDPPLFLSEKPEFGSKMWSQLN